jgi:YjgF/chorismate_mutase-like putative endoribonuclease
VALYQRLLQRLLLRLEACNSASRSGGTTLKIEAKLIEMGLTLPAAMRVPPGFQVKWRQVRILGTRAMIAGHGPRRADGTFSGKLGKLGADLTIEEGYAAARDTALGILGDLKRELGDLDRVVGWIRVFGMVNSASGFSAQPQVIDGFTDLMVALYGEEIAICPRTVAGVAELAFNSPVIIECEVEIAPNSI